MLIHFYVYFPVAGVPADGATEDTTQGTRYSSWFLFFWKRSARHFAVASRERPLVLEIGWSCSSVDVLFTENVKNMLKQTFNFRFLQIARVSAAYVQSLL